MKNYLTIFAAIGVLMASCKKDKTPFPLEPPYNDLEHGWYTEDCSDSWPDHWVDSFNTTSYYVDDHVVFKTPQFNPNNPDEIVYYHINYPENIRQLVKYNIKTRKKTILTDGMTIIGEPSWGSNGWIAFASTPSYQIFLVKDNGTETQQLTSENPNISPSYSADGKTIYFSSEPILGNLRNLIKKTLISNQIDTIIHMSEPTLYHISRNRKISRQDFILVGATIENNGHYAYLSSNSSDFVLLPIIDYSNNGLDYTDQFCWSHDSQFIYLAYYATGDIYRVAVTTGEIEQIRSDCFGRWLHSIDASPDGKYLVVEKVNLRFTILPNGWASSAVRMQSHITLIDLQTGQMKDLDLE